MYKHYNMNQLILPLDVEKKLQEKRGIVNERYPSFCIAVQLM